MCLDILTTEKNGTIFTCLNKEEFETLYKNVFIENEYPFHSQSKSPFIIDCGSHIGVTVLYWKHKFPYAHIVGFEPNPVTFDILKRNIEQNGLSRVEVINAALSGTEGTIDFYVSKELEGAWFWGDSAVKNAWYSEEENKTTRVRSVKLSSYITKEVDLLKLDIEGMEEVVLNEIEDKLSFVKEILMEFHGSSTNPANDPHRILSLLRKNEFTVLIKQYGQEVDEQEIKKEDPYWLLIHATKK